MSILPIQTILVPQGAEYKAVCRGLSRIDGLKPQAIAIPIGNLQGHGNSFSIAPLSKVLVMGLCGSLTPRYQQGDVVLYRNCVSLTNAARLMQECDRDLTALLYTHLEAKAAIVDALTSDRIICSAAEKRCLGEQYSADVVDMEGLTILEAIAGTGTAVSMLRVISDDCQHDIPNLNEAIAPDGSLRALPLARQMLRQPIAATRLIRGSLQGLSSLEQVTTALFTSDRL